MIPGLLYEHEDAKHRCALYEFGQYTYLPRCIWSIDYVYIVRHRRHIHRNAEITYSEIRAAFPRTVRRTARYRVVPQNQ